MKRGRTSLIPETLIMCSVLAGLVCSKHGCDRAVFNDLVYNYCLPVYSENMADSNYQNECPWATTVSHYNWLDKCVDLTANVTSCQKAGPKDEIFLEVHRTYFSHCSSLRDPDVPVLMLLTLPCVIATFLMPCLCTYLTTTNTDLQ